MPWPEGQWNSIRSTAPLPLQALLRRHPQLFFQLNILQPSFQVSNKTLI